MPLISIKKCISKNGHFFVSVIKKVATNVPKTAYSNYILTTEQVKVYCQNCGIDGPASEVI